MTHTYARGDTVTVINSTQGGRALIEGTATVVNVLRDTEEYYTVRFKDGDYCDRFIDPKAQSHPENFVQELNANIAAATKATA